MLGILAAEGTVRSSKLPLPLRVVRRIAPGLWML
jgi:hypothetical protein